MTTDNSQNDPVEQAKKEHYPINRRNFIKGTAVAGGTALAGFHPQSPVAAVDEAEALAPLIVFAGAAAGMAAGGALADYAIDKYLKDADSEMEDSSSPLREAAHSTAITTQGTSIQFLDNYENNLRFIEGNIEQVVDKDIITNFDTITSESEAVNIAESAASTYLNNTATSIAETYNFQALSAQQIMQQLDEAGYSGDYGTVLHVTASSQADLDDALETGANSLYSVGDGLILELKGDIDITGAEFKAFETTNGPIVVNGNGYNLTSDGSTSTIHGNTGNIEINNTSVDTVDNSGVSVNLLNSTQVDTMNNSSTGGGVYIDDTSSITTNNTSTLSEPVSVNPLSGNLTFDPSEAGVSTTTGVTNSAEETVDMTAIETNLATSYFSEDNPLTLAVPYDLDAGAFVDHTTKSLVVETSTSGVSDYAEILPMSTFWDTINTRDTLASDAYTSVSTYATSLWNDYISTNDTVGDLTDEERAYFADLLKDINTDDPRSVIQSYVGIYDGVLRPYDVDIKVRGVDSSTEYQGVLFSTDIISVVGESISVGDILQTAGGSTTETFTGVAQNDTVTVSNTPIQSIVSATDSGGTDVSSSVSIVDGQNGVVEYTGSSTIDLTLEYEYGVQRTFIVDPTDEEKMTKDLEGENFEVIDILDNGESVDSIDTRNYNFQDTDLTESANALDDLDVTISYTNGEDDGGALFGDSLPQWAQIGGAGAIVYGIYKIFMDDSDGGSGRFE